MNESEMEERARESSLSSFFFVPLHSPLPHRISTALRDVEYSI